MISGSPDGMPSIDAPMTLGSVLESQSMLETVTLTNWPSRGSFAECPTNAPYFFKLSSVVCNNLMSREGFRSLALTSTVLLDSNFRNLLQGLFSIEGTHEKPRSLILDSVHIYHDNLSTLGTEALNKQLCQHSALHLKT